MLARTSYDPGYVADARARIRLDVDRYRALVALLDPTSSEVARNAFEPTFFNLLVQNLEALFVHRVRAREGKDGNPLNEVRLLAVSLQENDGRLLADKQIKLDPATSVLGYAVGQQIEVREPEFLALAEAFFADLERKYA